MALYAGTVTPTSIVDGSATPIRDLTPLVSRARQSESDLSVTLTWHDELFGAAMPQPGQWLAASLNGTVVCVMLLESVSDYRMRSGERSMTLTARSRDAVSAWRDDPVATERYPQGTPLVSIAADVAFALGLDGLEVRLPGEPYGVPQAWYQASNVPAWELVTHCLLVLGYQPFVDAIGRLRAYSRDVLRAADVTISAERVLGYVGSKVMSPISQLRLKWRRPLPIKISQGQRVLGTTTVMAGFFARDAVREMYWSEDRTQQADLDPLLETGGSQTLNSRLFVKSDINRGVIDVGDQFFDPIFAEREDGSRGGCIGGRVRVDMVWHKEKMIAALQASKPLLAAIPDGVNIIGGHTISIGRAAQAVADVITLTLMCRMGAGVYEVQGNPYDLVNPVNHTTAFDPVSSPGGREDGIESDLVLDEAMAQQIVTREFIYRARAASDFTLTIIDDPRIEVGDVVSVQDGPRLLVTGVQRDLSPGSSNVVELSGFPA